MLWRLILSVLMLPFPWSIRRLVFVHLFGFAIDRSAYVGRSLILCQHLNMGPGSMIGYLNIIRRVERVSLAAHATIGYLNWISARTADHDLLLNKGAIRKSELVLDEHASVTNRHLIECSDRVHIGAFSTVGGWRSQLLTRGADITESRQSAEPLIIGRYCLVATGAILLKGAELPDYSVLAAGSVLAHRMTETYSLYSGVPAVRVRALDAKAAYFQRTTGPMP